MKDNHSSSVGIVAWLWAGQQTNMSSIPASRSGLEAIQLSAHGGSKFLSVQIEQPGHEGASSCPSSVDAKNACTCTITPQYSFLAWCLFIHMHNVIILPDAMKY
jgi:hypothetical protein